MDLQASSRFYTVKIACDDWVQRWVQVARRFACSLSRKLRRVNEIVDGYEPGGRRFESCWAHQHSLCQQLNNCVKRE